MIGEEPVPLPLCLSQMSHQLLWDCTKVLATKIRLLTPCFEARHFSPTAEHFRTVNRLQINHLICLEMMLVTDVCSIDANQVMGNRI
jgi:hypothetical protein